METDEKDNLRGELEFQLRLARLRAEAIEIYSGNAPVERLLDFFVQKLTEFCACDQIVYTDVEGRDRFWDVSGTRVVPAETCARCPYRLPQSEIYAQGYVEVGNVAELPAGLAIAPGCPVRRFAAQQIVVRGKVVGLLTIHYMSLSRPFTAQMRETFRLVCDLLGPALERRQVEGERAAADSRDAILSNVARSVFGYILTVDLETMEYDLTPGTGMAATVERLSRSTDYRAAYEAKLVQLEEAGRRQFAEVLAPERLLEAAASAGRGLHRTVEHRVSHLGQSRWEEMAVYFGEDRGGRRVATLTVRDVTAAHDRMEAEREAERHANEAKRYFFSTVSHDIRTPLNAIVGYAGMLREGISDPAEREQALEAIASSGSMLMELINDVLDLSKLESGKMEIVPVPTDVARIVRETAGAFSLSLARRNVRLDLDVPRLPPLSLDPQRIRQILFNLLGNAVKFTRRGSITVRVRREGCAFSLAVADTGCGIPQEEQGRLMQPYVQVRGGGRNGGTGLGLAICKQLASRMGGTLSLVSVPNEGSTFTLTIPCVREAAALPSAAGEVELRANPDLRVLIVDDSPVNLMVLAAMLARLGIRNVVKAANGREALDSIRLVPADVVLTDLWMPVMDGTEFVATIRAEEREHGLPRLPVYAVTADVEALKNAAKLGFDGVVVKPVARRDLAAVLGVVG